MVTRRRRSPGKKSKPPLEDEQEAIVARYNELFLKITEGKSRSELAELLGVSESRVSQLRTAANANPQLMTMAAVGHALGVRFTINVEPL